MISGKKRIRKSSKYLMHINEGDKAYIGLAITEDIIKKMKEIGFVSITPGETLVPSPKLGSVSRFNANGKYVSQKDKPKEEAFRQSSWELTDWGGNYHSGTSVIRYMRFPRIWIPCPWIELTIIQSEGKLFIIAGAAIIKGQTKEEDIVHLINLMLQIFKQVEIFSGDLKSYETPKLIKLSWNVLPPGNMPWDEFKTHLNPIMQNKTKGTSRLIYDRLETIFHYKPDFQALGENGYRGYIIFGFIKQNLYIFESAEYGNATYVFEGDWKQLSKMTKAEIIHGQLCKHRFLHYKDWKDDIEGLFSHDHDKAI